MARKLYFGKPWNEPGYAYPWISFEDNPEFSLTGAKHKLCQACLQALKKGLLSYEPTHEIGIGPGEYCWKAVLGMEAATSPEEAQRLGLVTAVCEPEELLQTVMAFANDLAAKPPLAIANIKKAIHEGSSMPLQDGLMLERKLFFDALRSEDAINIMRIYVAAGQDRDKLLALLEEVGSDPEKIAELLASEKD